MIKVDTQGGEHHTCSYTIRTKHPMSLNQRQELKTHTREGFAHRIKWGNF